MGTFHNGIGNISQYIRIYLTLLLGNIQQCFIVNCTTILENTSQCFRGAFRNDSWYIPQHVGENYSILYSGAFHKMFERTFLNDLWFILQCFLGNVQGYIPLCSRIYSTIPQDTSDNAVCEHFTTLQSTFHNARSLIFLSSNIIKDPILQSRLYSSKDGAVCFLLLFSFCGKQFSW